MAITVEVLADSTHLSRGNYRRLTTFQARYHRSILSEVNTIRLFSRNSASSRAIPVERMIRDVLEDPAMPVFWGRNQRGMSAAESLDPGEIEAAKVVWLNARDEAVESVRKLLKIGLHKQNANRILEPWMWTTSIITATDWANMYKLRRHKEAQPEFHALADAMFAAHKASVPVDRTRMVGIERWHLPLIQEGEREEFGDDAVKVSTGRCARISYLTHDGVRDPAADIELHDRLSGNGHWSPFEHQALPGTGWSGNLYFWEPYRKMLPTEHPYEPGQVFPDGME